ncbi:hypothetical protein ACTG9Q_03995 [Actinokineospora sp. 24-640]
MTVDEQDPAVVRLREESGSVLVAPRGADLVLRRVHERRRVQRQHRMQAVAALGVVLVAIVGAVLVPRGAQSPSIPAAAVPAVAEWPMRGSLAEDADLLARAEAVWRRSPHRPSGAVRALFAGAPEYFGTANFAVVAMASTEGAVAFVTTPVGRQIDTSTLLLRATSRVTAGQPGIGFIAARPDPRDEVSGVAFGLGAPGAGLSLRSSEIDFPIGGPVPGADGAVWTQVPAGVGAWNSSFEAGPLGGVVPAAGTADPVTGPVGLRSVAEGLVADGASAGDLIVTSAGLLGVVASGGLVDTRLSALGEVRMYHSGVTGTVTDAGRFLPSGEVSPGNRVLLVRGDITVTVGRVVEDGPGWRLERAVDPAAAARETARRVSPE